VLPLDAALVHADAALAAGRLDQAEEGYRTVLGARPDHAGALWRFAELARRRGHLALGLHLLRAAAAADPAECQAWRLLGNELARRGDVAAHRMHRRATAALPSAVEAWFDRAVTLVDDNRDAEGTAALRRALALAPDSPLLRMMWGIRRLAHGDYRRGFAHYAARWEVPWLVPWAARWRGRRWRGEPIAGKTVLVLGEQGFGDDLMCLRFLPRLKAMGARVMLALSPPLAPLARDLPAVDVFLESGEPVPPCDFEIPMFDLPWRVGLGRPADAACPPYLQADPGKVAEWRDRLGPATGLRIGIAWAGRPSHPLDARRSLSLSALAPLLGMTGCEFHSLQLGAAAAAAAGTPVIDHQAELRAFDDTAALMSVLDLVISVDSAPVHLAGALGRPVWAMLYAPAEWRWGTSGDTTPWYGSARLFRQQAVGDWAPVVGQICAALADMLNRQSA
jgi:hypothetical protein